MPNPSVDDTHSYFAGMSHQQLLDMVKNADPTTLSNRSGALSSASTTLSDISQQLTSNVRQLEWTGPAADSFRDWAGKISTATQNLSDYAQTSSTSLETASTALGTASKAIPPLPSKDMDTVNRYNWQPCVPLASEAQMKAQNPNFVTTAEMQAAQANVTKDHEDAITAMTTLAGAYTQSTSEIQSQTPPLFPPTPTSVMGPEPQSVWSATGVNYGGGSNGGGTSGGSRGGGSTYQPSPQQRVVQPAPPTVHPPVTGPTPVPNPPKPPPVHTGPVRQPYQPVGPVQPIPVQPVPVNPPVSNPVVPPPSTGIDSAPPAPTLPPPTGTTGGLPRRASRVGAASRPVRTVRSASAATREP